MVERRAAVEAALLAEPRTSDADIARRCDVSSPTAKDIRRRMEAVGRIPRVTTRICGDRVQRTTGRGKPPDPILARVITDDLAQFLAVEPEASLVYFIGGNTGPIKVGHSACLGDRIAEIQSGSPLLVRVHALFRGSVADERAMHGAMVPARSHHEWFDRDAARSVFEIAATMRPERVVMPWLGRVVPPSRGAQ